MKTLKRKSCDTLTFNSIRCPLFLARSGWHSVNAISCECVWRGACPSRHFVIIYSIHVNKINTNLQFLLRCQCLQHCHIAKIFVPSAMNTNGVVGISVCARVLCVRSFTKTMHFYYIYFCIRLWNACQNIRKSRRYAFKKTEWKERKREERRGTKRDGNCMFVCVKINSNRDKFKSNGWHCHSVHFSVA